jgi:hypothetical protein
VYVYAYVYVFVYVYVCVCGCVIVCVLCTTFVSVRALWGVGPRQQRLCPVRACSHSVPRTFQRWRRKLKSFVDPNAKLLLAVLETRHRMHRDRARQSLTGAGLDGRLAGVGPALPLALGPSRVVPTWEPLQHLQQLQQRQGTKSESAHAATEHRRDDLEDHGPNGFLHSRRARWAGLCAAGHCAPRTPCCTVVRVGVLQFCVWSGCACSWGVRVCVHRLVPRPAPPPHVLVLRAANCPFP